MGEIRTFRESDVPEVAALELKVFRKRKNGAGRDLEEYFCDIFFRNPWRNDGLSSLVYLQDGRIVGFLGVIPRPMVFRSRPIRVAVITQLMADSDAYRGFAGVELLRRVFQGPQDLTFTDGATESAYSAWKAAGAKVSQLYSLVWRRTLRPAAFLRNRLETRRQNSVFRAASKILSPAFDLTDALLAKLPFRAVSPPKTEFCSQLVGADDLLETVKSLGWRDLLQPAYEPESFRWLIAQAAACHAHGTLRAAVVRDAARAPVGWYVYYAKPNGDSSVLQIGGRPRNFNRIFVALTQDAWLQGATAVSGQVIPRYLANFSYQHCNLRYDGNGVLFHARDSLLLDCILQGEAALSRLDGEWWLRFAVEDWS